jgi:spectinomycin phosphotransferase
VRPVTDRFAAALYPYVDGTSYVHGTYPTREERLAVLGLLTALHGATASVRTTAMTDGLTVPGRDRLETAMDHLDDPWVQGPFGEGARELLARHATALDQAFPDKTPRQEGTAGA